MTEFAAAPGPPPRILRLTLSYDGGDYHGWQAQPGRATVQRAVGEAIAAVTGEHAVVHASGRTDAGVHALAQVVHFELTGRSLPASGLLKALNARLPAAIRVLETAEMPAGFHARHNATGKLYRYRIHREAVCPPFLARYVYHYPYPLDEAAMRAAAPAFAGRHDFRSFAASLTTVDGVRTVFRSELNRQGAELVYEISGAGFLHHMVRNLVGFLLEIGRGARTAAEIPAVLAAQTRAAAGPTAPARGLYLVRVDYDRQPC